MSESIKAVLSLILIVAIIVAVLFWWDDRPNQTAWIVRIASSVTVVIALAGLMALHWRKDVVADYLRPICGDRFFNRDGFSFAFSAVEKDGVCQFVAYFQNQQDQPSLGRITLRPARGFFLTRAKIEAISFDIECEPAAFGIATVPVPLPPDLCGRKQSFEVGASVEYPQGKGRRVRFRDGIFLRTNAAFGNPFGTALTVAGAMTGQIVMTRPATVKIELPLAATDEIPAGMVPEVRTLWRLGDPPLAPGAIV
jgi:hypothetical protein